MDKFHAIDKNYGMDEWDYIILSSDIKYGKYIIPSSDYCLESPYSVYNIPGCFSKLDFWLYKVYCKAVKKFKSGCFHFRKNQKSTAKLGSLNSASSLGIPWIQIMEMIPFIHRNTIHLTQDSQLEIMDLINVLVIILDHVILEVGNRTIYFPQSSRFVISDLSNFSDLIQETYSLVLIDPPWPNKSVTRSKKYQSIDIYSLYDLNLDKITTDSSLVAIWVSNNPKIQSFIKDKYFKSLNISIIEEWYWMKVTISGELVVSFSQPSHRKPFEVLYIGQVNRRKIVENKVQRKVILSVPSKHHSRKPFVHGIYFNF